MNFAETVKEGGRLIRRRVTAALRDDSVTLRGELLVARPGMTDVAEEEVRATGVLAALVPLQSILPGTKISVQKTLLGVDVCFFCYDTVPGSPDFQSELCRILEDAAAMLENANMEVRLNARGEWKRLDRVESFCCMNKGRTVSCKAVGEEERRIFFKGARESASNAIENM